MLVLTRNVRQSTYLKTQDGLEIKVTILSINGEQVKIGFDALQSVNIVREEIMDLPPKPGGEIPSDDFYNR